VTGDSPTVSEPRTEAGKALWDHLAVAGRPSVERIAEFILAIEAEAAHIDVPAALRVES